LDETNRKLVA